jgi:hypothetical protein
MRWLPSEGENFERGTACQIEFRLIQMHGCR